MSLALLATSHSPLLEHADLDPMVADELDEAFDTARTFVKDFDPDLVINFGPDHYNGFFYQLMPPFCIGYAAESIGDYGSQAGRLDVPEDIARGLAEAVLATASTSRSPSTCRSTTAQSSPWRSSTATSPRSRSSRSSSTPSPRRSPRSSE